MFISILPRIAVIPAVIKPFQMISFKKMDELEKKSQCKEFGFH